MILTIKVHMTTRDGEPMPLSEALKMFYSGRLSKIADELNREALEEAGLDHIDLQSIELERTPKNHTLLVIKTAAIKREHHD